MFPQVFTTINLCCKHVSNVNIARCLSRRVGICPGLGLRLIKSTTTMMCSHPSKSWQRAVHLSKYQMGDGPNNTRPRHRPSITTIISNNSNTTSSHRSSSTNRENGRTTLCNFKVIDGEINSSSNSFQKNKENSQILEETYSKLLSDIHGGGGPRGMKQHTEVNKKLFVRDRLRCLLDDGDFLELSPLAGQGMSYGNIPAAGIVNVIGKINGRWCVVIANDATVKGGTVFPIGVKKQLRAQEISQHNRLPSVYLVDSGGGFLPLQAELFPDKEHGGRTFYNEAILSSLKIPQVAIVCGSCTAGGAYVPCMADEAVMVHRIGTIFLGGPPLVQAAIGEKVSAEELGGATMHCSVSGVADHFAQTEDEAFEMGRNIIETLNEPFPDHPKEFVDPIFSADDLSGLAPLHCHDDEYSPYKILARLVDGSQFQEFKQRFGTSLVTGFATIQGQLVAIVANNGHLSYECALKGAHFVEICCQRNITIIFLQNTLPDNPEIDSELDSESLGHLLRARAKMVAVVACASVPKISIVTGGCFGPNSFAMCGKSFDPRFHFLWPNAQIGITNQTDMTSALIQDTLSKKDNSIADDEKQRITTEASSLVHQKMSAFYSSSRSFDDGIILPKDTRNVLGKCLNIISQHREARNTQYGVIRM